MAIKCKIDGAKDSTDEYDDDEFLRLDSLAREVLTEFFETGATVENVQELVEGALTDADAAR